MKHRTCYSLAVWKNSELPKNYSNCCEQINYLMKRAVISSHLTEQALEDLEIRIIVNGVDMVGSRIRVAPGLG